MKQFNGIHEECGIFGIYRDAVSDVAADVYYGLYSLQHRGQESAGIVVNNRGVARSHKDRGLVNEVFNRAVLDELGEGNMAIGHVRYGTYGGNTRENAQPLIVNHVKGSMAIAHNGNITNAAILREELELKGSIFHTTSDTEVIAYVFTEARLEKGSIEEAVAASMDRLQGAYCLVIMSPQKLIGVRDPLGIRPLCIGKVDDGYVLASETCALDSIGAKYIRDVRPGEIVVIDENGLRSNTDHCFDEPHALCVFEYIYFARPDSRIEGDSVHVARRRAGAMLAQQHPVEADVVIGVPDSGIDAAIGYAAEAGIPYGLGFIKNKYIGRTFIEPGQKVRENLVRIKLNVVDSTVRGKRVVMIDDSIVRGTTGARIVRLLREAGATEVHMRVTAPPFLHSCYYGTDISSRDYLVAAHRTVEETAKAMDLDSLGYLDVNSLEDIPEKYRGGVCTACFTGKYPSDTTGVEKKFELEERLNRKL